MGASVSKPWPPVTIDDAWPFFFLAWLETLAVAFEPTGMIAGAGGGGAGGGGGGGFGTNLLTLHSFFKRLPNRAIA